MVLAPRLLFRHGDLFALVTVLTVLLRRIVVHAASPADLVIHFFDAGTVSFSTRPTFSVPLFFSPCSLPRRLDRFNPREFSVSGRCPCHRAGGGGGDGWPGAAASFLVGGFFSVEKAGAKMRVQPADFVDAYHRADLPGRRRLLDTRSLISIIMRRDVSLQTRSQGHSSGEWVLEGPVN
jgi:hypothetical protein